ncbi:hypothetical protein P8452_48668 [Trifolium repens]|nr:hypothetical protein P8452_48668 [Trifolium repens]
MITKSPKQQGASNWHKHLHHYCHILQHTHFISISCICVHLHLLQHSSLKTRRSIKALSCHLKLSSLKTRKEQKDGGYKFRIQ